MRFSEFMDVVCEARNIAKDRNYDCGYSEDLGIGIGEITYYVSNDRDFASFKIVCRDNRYTSFVARWDREDGAYFTEREAFGPFIEIDSKLWLNNLKNKA